MLLLISWLLTSILGYAAVAKTVQFIRFKNQVEGMLIGFSSAVAGAVAISVVLAEYLLAVLLASGRLLTLAMFGAAGLFGVFTIFVGWVLFTKRKVSCYCFGEEDAVISPLTLWRNLILVGFATTGGALSMHQGVDWSSPGSILAVMAGMSSACLFIAAYQLAILWKASENFV